MVEWLMAPDPRGSRAVQQTRRGAGVPHVAAGIWVGTIAVLVLPSPGPQKHRVTEEHLVRAYGVVMSAFALL